MGARQAGRSAGVPARPSAPSSAWPTARSSGSLWAWPTIENPTGRPSTVPVARFRVRSPKGLAPRNDEHRSARGFRSYVRFARVSRIRPWVRGRNCAPLRAEELQHRPRRRQQDLVLAGEHEPLPDHRQAVDVERHQPPLVEFGGHVCAEMKAMPRPAITACLMVSLLLISMPMVGRTPRGFEQLLHQAARARSGLARQEGFVGEVARARCGTFAPADAPVGAMMTWG